MRLRAFLLAALLVALTLAGAASANTIYVAPSGSDANDCLSPRAPCATLQAAANKASPNGEHSTVLMADGTYSAGVDVVYHKTVSFFGNCENPGAVVVSTPSATAFQGQDQAILTVSCVRVDAPGGIGFYARQFAIVDYDRVTFGPAHVHVLAGEMSKINCLGMRIAGSATYHAMASGMSTVNLSCAMTVDPGLSFYAFVWEAERSFIMAATASVTGDAAGMQYVNDTSLLKLPVAGKLPGASGICQNGCQIQ